MSEEDKPHIRYLHMGPWPCYVGFTTSQQAFDKEMTRIGMSDVNWMGGGHSAGCAHFLEDHTGTLNCVVTIQKQSKRSKAQVAGLIAHEALHVVQAMERRFFEGGRFDDETESYLVQYMTQEFLAEYYQPQSGRRTIAPLGHEHA